MRVLHVLSQRPSLTGSGITLDALVRHAAAKGWDQRVVVGTPAGDPRPPVGGLEGPFIDPLVFGSPPLDFELPGMSDVMPYPSSRFSELRPTQIDAYREAWTKHLEHVVEDFEPDIIHSHHIWLMSALVKDVATGIPVLTHCHATGLRQMELCPHLADDVRRGCSRNEAFAVLHRGHASELETRLGIPGHKIHRVGAGYRDDLFHTHDRAQEENPALLFIGKFSRSKGLPELLDAFDRVRTHRPELRLHVAGGGSGNEADELRARMERMAPSVEMHGRLPQSAVADLARRATVCVLPSFYEGLPLVLVEALACGCHLVATNLQGIREELAPRLGDALTLVPSPRMISIDRPDPGSLPVFVDDLATAIDQSLDKAPIGDPKASLPEALETFSWTAVFERVERIWQGLL